MAPALLKPGAVLDNKYRILQVLDQGAMGCVYEASHELIGDRVAIKCLLSETPSAVALERFLREAKVIRAIRSVHAVKVLEIGQLPDGNPFLVMERLQGSNLEEHLQSCGALSPPEVAGLLIQVCDGLVEAHKAGVVHRDLKPENLFLSRDSDGSSCLKVLDFGVSKILSPEATLQAQLKTAGPVGTPLFMSPEQIQGQTIDARSDLWSLGVLMFYLLSESFPFESPTLEGLSVQICTTSPRDLAELNPGVPEELLSLIRDCLARDPTKRPASVGEVASRLRPVASASSGPLIERIHRILGSAEEPLLHPVQRNTPEEPLPLSLTLAEEDPHKPPASPKIASPAPARTNEPRATRRGGWSLALGGALLLLVGGWVARSREPSPPPVLAVPLGNEQPSLALPPSSAPDVLPNHSAEPAPPPATSTSSKPATSKPPERAQPSPPRRPPAPTIPREEPPPSPSPRSPAPLGEPPKPPDPKQPAIQDRK